MIVEVYRIDGRMLSFWFSLEFTKFIVLSIVHLPTIKVEASKGIIGNKMAVRYDAGPIGNA